MHQIEKAVNEGLFKKLKGNDYDQDGRSFTLELWSGGTQLDMRDRGLFRSMSDSIEWHVEFARPALGRVSCECEIASGTAIGYQQSTAHKLTIANRDSHDPSKFHGRVSFPMNVTEDDSEFTVYAGRTLIVVFTAVSEGVLHNNSVEHLERVIRDLRAQLARKNEIIADAVARLTADDDPAHGRRGSGMLRTNN